MRRRRRRLRRMRRPRRQGALRIALVAPLVLAALVAREAAAFGEKLPWGSHLLDKAFGLPLSTASKPSQKQQQQQQQPKPAAAARPPPPPPPARAASGDGVDGGGGSVSRQGATCWSRDCSAKFPERACDTVGSLSVECDALIDAGVAYPTREACCRKTFGPAGCGTGCYVPKEQQQQQQQQRRLAPGTGGDSSGGAGGSSASPNPAAPSPNRECALLSEPARCTARRRARLPAYATEPECCEAVYGGACMRFPDRCYAADPEWPGQCRAVDGAPECAALYWAARDKAMATGVVIGEDGGLASDDDEDEDGDEDGGEDGGEDGEGSSSGVGSSSMGNKSTDAAATTTAAKNDNDDDDRSPPGRSAPGRRRRELGFSLTREACCRANGFDRAYCAQTVECYEPDRAALPARRCRVTESARCLERMAAGLAYSTRGECCASAFGRGRGCREFPAACYRFNPREFAADGEPVRPFDACPRVEGASVDKCALLLEQDGLAAREAAKEAARAAKEAARSRGVVVMGGGGSGKQQQQQRPGGGGGAVIGDGAPSPPSPLPRPLTTPRVFEQRVDCCAAAMPLGWVDFGSPDIERGCPYAPSSCWAPMRARARPRPGVPPGSFDVFCAPVRARPAVECARRVTAGTAWPTRDECCRRVGGCARLPPRRPPPGEQAAAAARGRKWTTTIVRGPADPRAYASSAAASVADSVFGSSSSSSLGSGADGGGRGGGSSSSSSVGEKVVLVRRQRGGERGAGGAGDGAGIPAPPSAGGGGGRGAQAGRQGLGGQAAPPKAAPPPPPRVPAPALPPPPPPALARARPRTAREIATDPADAAPWVATSERERQAAIATATAGAPAPRTVLPAQSGRQLYQRERGQGPARAGSPRRQRGGGGNDEGAGVVSPVSWPATPVEQQQQLRPLDRPAPPPAGPAPVVAAPFAGMAYYASGRRRRE